MELAGYSEASVALVFLPRCGNIIVYKNIIADVIIRKSHSAHLKEDCKE